MFDVRTAYVLYSLHQLQYQLSLIDPRDGIVLSTELDDHCDKQAVDRRSSDVLSTWLTDDGPVYHALSVHLSRAKLTTRFVVTNFFSLGKSSGGKYPNISSYMNFLTTQCRTGRTKPPCQNQINSFIRFDRSLTCDRQTDTDRRTEGHSYYPR